MFVLIMDRNLDRESGSWWITIHATRAEAEEAIQEYARTAWIDHYGSISEWSSEITKCIDYLEAGWEYIRLFRADPGAGLGDEIFLGGAAQRAAFAKQPDERTDQ